MDNASKVIYRFKGGRGVCHHKAHSGRYTKDKFFCNPKGCPYLEDCLLNSYERTKFNGGNHGK